MKLYEINQAIQDVLDGYEVIDPETGEIMGFGSLDELQMMREEKLENIGCYIKSLKADAVELKAQEDNLKKRRQSVEAKAERLKEYLQEQLAGEKIKSARVSVSYTTSQSVVIDDGATVPEEFTRIIPEQREADKTALKQAMKGGMVFDGIRLDTRKNIIIK